MHFSRLCHLAGWPVAAAGLLLTAQSATAQQAAAQPELPQLSEVTVRSTLQESALEQTPASVTVLDGERMRERNLQVNLSESLGAAPGLQLQKRQN